MHESYKNHLERLQQALNSDYTLHNLSNWIEEKTYLNSEKFSFKDHEFQRTIIDDPAKTSIVVKIAQAGISEILARWALAASCTQDNLSIIYTFPTTGDAEKFCKTRIDPCITASPELANNISPALNNSEIKQFGANSFIYFRGTVSETAALSVPADIVIHDEVDKSNLDQMSVYVSRLQHKQTRVRKMFSTPTVSKYGISKEAETAKRNREIMCCSHCNHYFAPDYFENIHIPGWTKDKREITKYNLKDINYKKAVLLCPKCGKEPDPGPNFREWVVENPSDNYESNAWFLTPFCAPAIITPAYMVKTSTEFERYSEFMNQVLGITAEEQEDTITEEDLQKAILHADLADSSTHLLGADIGMICYVTIGRVTATQELVIVHRETIPAQKFEQRRRELCAKYKVTISVHDSQPYVDLIDRITQYDPNAYGAVFTTGNPGLLYTVKEQEPDAQEGKLNMRRVNLARTLLFDSLMAEIKRGMIKVQYQGELDYVWIQQMRSLKRVRKIDRSGELTYIWEKTDGQDHFHFSLAYLLVASKMRGLVSGYRSPSVVPLASKFRLKQM